MPSGLDSFVTTRALVMHGAVAGNRLYPFGMVTAALVIHGMGLCVRYFIAQ